MKVFASAPLLALSAAAAFDSPHNLSPKTRRICEQNVALRQCAAAARGVWMDLDPFS